ncbi:MAG TPA: hypothetical protein VF008_26160, partial [Niastella sp.]
EFGGQIDQKRILNIKYPILNVEVGIQKRILNIKCSILNVEVVFTSTLDIQYSIFNIPGLNLSLSAC